uniref:FK506 binding protein 11 n=1 Tax=Nothobranchius korthausae TaxID=1143690 RepID=A0A1A8G651_9TELE
MKTRVFLLLLAAFSCELVRAEEENEAEELQVETLVQPESCTMISEIGDTLKIHYTVPGDATLQFEVEVITLSRKTPFEKMIRSLLPTTCLVLLPGLLCLIAIYIYKRGTAERPEKKKAKDKKSKNK